MYKKIDMSRTCIRINSSIWEKYCKKEISFDVLFKWMAKHCGNCIYATEDGCSYDDFKYKKMNNSEYLEKILNKSLASNKNF